MSEAVASAVPVASSSQRASEAEALPSVPSLALPSVPAAVIEDGPSSRSDLSADASSGPSLPTEEPFESPHDDDDETLQQLGLGSARQRRPGRLTLLAGGVLAAALAACAVVFLSSASSARAVTPLPPAPASASATGTLPAVAPSPSPPVVPDVRPSPSVDRAAATTERWEARAALEIGDLRRAADVAARAVAHDPSEADGFLLLVAAQLELGDVSGAHRSLASCAAQASRGPRGECLSLMQPNGP